MHRFALTTSLGALMALIGAGPAAAADAPVLHDDAGTNADRPESVVSGRTL